MSGGKDMSFPPILVKSQGENIELATFAAGCFWSVELVFQRLSGVLNTQVGYTGGNKENPTYQEVCAGSTNHAESVLLEYDNQQITYKDLLKVFWDKHDPTQINRQGGDIGTQYRSVIFYHSEQQKKEAEQSRDEIQKLYPGKPIATQIIPAVTFYPAETYHQKYLEKGGQCSYKGCKDSIRCYG
ncbi:hypothetical protein BB559_006595 [Furculomyces boomerangus]|uniref:peptide-methionine (S)-S-oxide reductase n=2 Tax=Harpellales TaxID=61421 RepID=A0A2T9Y1L7_9FUNG|nr:hypothetical protein BB559_006595 [Furculomyces boomerangus]PWA03744.1 hypothetical protein BB558_000087 [Smittium angustum]